jgi:hypothetical protein
MFRTKGSHGHKGILSFGDGSQKRNEPTLAPVSQPKCRYMPQSPCQPENEKESYRPPFSTNNLDSATKLLKTANEIAADSFFCRIYLHRSCRPLDAKESDHLPAQRSSVDCKSGSHVFNNEPARRSSKEDGESISAGSVGKFGSYGYTGKKNPTVEYGIRLAKA